MEQGKDRPSSHVYEKAQKRSQSKMGKLKKQKPIGVLKVTRVFCNKRNNQLTVILHRKKMKALKGGIPSRLEISYW